MDWSYGLILWIDLMDWSHDFFLWIDLMDWSYELILWIDLIDRSYGLILWIDLMDWSYGLILWIDPMDWSHGLIPWIDPMVLWIDNIDSFSIIQFTQLDTNSKMYFQPTNCHFKLLGFCTKCKFTKIIQRNNSSEFFWNIRFSRLWKIF